MGEGNCYICSAAEVYHHHHLLKSVVCSVSIWPHILQEHSTLHTNGARKVTVCFISLYLADNNSRQIQKPLLDIRYSQHFTVVYISSDVWVLTEMMRGIIIISLQLYCKILCEPLSIWVFGSICRKKFKCAHCLVCGGEARELYCVM